MMRRHVPSKTRHMPLQTAQTSGHVNTRPATRSRRGKAGRRRRCDILSIHGSESVPQRDNARSIRLSGSGSKASVAPSRHRNTRPLDGTQRAIVAAAVAFAFVSAVVQVCGG